MCAEVEQRPLYRRSSNNLQYWRRLTCNIHAWSQMIWSQLINQRNTRVFPSWSRTEADLIPSKGAHHSKKSAVSMGGLIEGSPKILEVPTAGHVFELQSLEMIFQSKIKSPIYGPGLGLVTRNFKWIRPKPAPLTSAQVTKKVISGARHKRKK